MYASEQDLDAAWSRSLIDLLTIDETTTLRDGVKIAAVLDRADALIDSYLARRYEVPIQATESGVITLRRIAVDLAVGDLATSADRATEIIENRRKDAVAFLRDVASGKADIPLLSEDASSGNEPEIITNDRRFSRTSQRGLL